MKITRREFLLRQAPRELHIASCVVQIRPEKLRPARERIESVIGWPVTAIGDNGKAVVILEGDTTGALLDQMERIRAVPGVVTVEMVYQHAESERTMQEKAE